MRRNRRLWHPGPKSIFVRDFDYLEIVCSHKDSIFKYQICIGIAEQITSCIRILYILTSRLDSFSTFTSTTYLHLQLLCHFHRATARHNVPCKKSLYNNNEHVCSLRCVFVCVSVCTSFALIRPYHCCFSFSSSSICHKFRYTSTAAS